MLINERFKSPNKEFEKVYAIFDKRDYFNNKGLAKTQIGNFKRALEKNDKGAQKLLDAHKGNMDSAISYIEEFISDGNKKKSFESFQEFSSMVNALEMSTKPNLKQKPAESIKRRIHNNSQKYSMALYSAIRKQKFNNYKDVHKDVDELTAKNESVEEATFRPNSGTMSGGVLQLDNKKYKLKRDVKGVQIGDYTNVILPKGTIIYNVPGGVFAHQDVLAAYQSGQNKYFNKPTLKGISIKRTKNTIMAIEKNSKILESVNESMFSMIDLIRQDSKDVRDFVKKVFKDKEFKKMSNDKDFIKYLKSIYEGVVEEAQSPAQKAAFQKMLDKKAGKDESKEEEVNEIAKFAGWVAIDHKGKRLEIKKSEAKDLYNAKLLAIKKLKVPKSKESMLAIKPAYNESIELHKKKFNEELSKELAFEVITFMERPIMESSIPNEFDTKDVIDMLVNEGIENVLTKDVHSEFTELLKKYK